MPMQKFLSTELIESWLTSTNPLEKWIELFSLASLKVVDSGQKVEKKISFTDLQKAQSDHIRLRSWKTPAKRKVKQESDFVSKHQRLISEITDSYSSQDLTKVVSEIDQRVTDLLNGLDFLREIQVEDSTLSFDYFSSTDNKVQYLLESVRNKPQDIDPSMNAPDLWLAVTSIISKMKLIPSEMTKLVTKLTSPIQEALDRKISKHQFTTSISGLESQLSQLQDYCLELTNEVSGQYQLISNQTFNQGSPLNRTLPVANLTSQPNLDLDTRLTKLEGEVRSLNNAGDNSVVKYSDLRFKSLSEATKWLNDHFRSDSGLFGYLLDFHMMMQHISSESSSG